MHFDLDGQNTSHFTRPSSQVTGFMTSWLPEILADNPCLIRIEPYFYVYDRNELDDRWFEQAGGFRVRSYDNGADTLYHLRWKFYDSLGFLMAPHVVSYTPSPWAWTSTDDPGAFDSDLEGEGHNDRDVYEDLEEGWVDFTSFHGVPLPASLLRWVYEVSHKHGIEWEVGGRGLVLADEAWEVLRGWRNEVRVTEEL